MDVFDKKTVIIAHMDELVSLSTFRATAVRRNIEPGDRTYSCLNQCIEVAMGSIIPTTAVGVPRLLAMG